MRRKQDLEVFEGLLIVDWWIGSLDIRSEVAFGCLLARDFVWPLSA